MQQLSIFLENKSGRLYEIMEIIAKADIRIIAATVADTSEYGILRLITSDTRKAYEELRRNNVSVNLSEVIALSSGSSAGAFYDKLKLLAQEGVGVEYMYCFSVRDKAFLILRVSDCAAAQQVIAKHNLETFTNQDLIAL